jgi:hypothetical protein
VAYRVRSPKPEMMPPQPRPANPSSILSIGTLAPPSDLPWWAWDAFSAWGDGEPRAVAGGGGTCVAMDATGKGNWRAVDCAQAVRHREYEK